MPSVRRFGKNTRKRNDRGTKRDVKSRKDMRLFSGAAQMSS